MVCVCVLPVQRAAAGAPPASPLLHPQVYTYIDLLRPEVYTYIPMYVCMYIYIYVYIYMDVFVCGTLVRRDLLCSASAVRKAVSKAVVQQ
jgi:hypothetical protein